MANTSIAASIFADADRHRRLMASVARTQPVLDAFKSQEERRSKMLASFIRSPALEAFGAQKKTTNAILKSFGRSGALDAFTGQKKTTEAILRSFGRSDALDAFTGQRKTTDAILKSLGRSDALEAFTGQNGKWLEHIRKTIDTSAVFASLGAQEQERHRQLLAAVGRSPVIEQAFRNWKVALPPGMAEQMANFQSRVLADVVVDAPPYVDDSNPDDPWFGAESWSRLVFEMVTILRCADLMAAGMTAAKDKFNAPVPSNVMYLFWMFLAAAELAAHFAKPAAERMDKASGNALSGFRLFWGADRKVQKRPWGNVWGNTRSERGRLGPRCGR